MNSKPVIAELTPSSSPDFSCSHANSFFDPCVSCNRSEFPEDAATLRFREEELARYDEYVTYIDGDDFFDD
jgi:hypothetical protein